MPFMTSCLVVNSTFISVLTYLLTYHLVLLHAVEAHSFNLSNPLLDP